MRLTGTLATGSPLPQGRAIALAGNGASLAAAAILFAAVGFNFNLDPLKDGRMREQTRVLATYARGV